jgi:hypothetical protein
MRGCEKKEVRKMLAGAVPPIINAPDASPTWVGLALAAGFALVAVIASVWAWWSHRERPEARPELPELRKAA